jgi:hypothetical protein
VEKCRLHRKRQHDLCYQQAEETRAKNRRLQSQIPVEELISNFHAAVECGPVYVCSSCDQLWYRYSVRKAAGLYACNLPRVHTTLLGTISESNTEWVCNTCYKYLKQNRLPPMAIANNLEFIATPQHLPVLTNHEWRVLSPRLAFMKIYEAPVGRQLKIYGNVVNVVSDCVSTVQMLPRCSSQFETVALQFKRRSQYKHAFMSANIRPNCIREVGQYLSENGDLFQREHIVFSNHQFETLQIEHAGIMPAENMSASNSETSNDIQTVDDVNILQDNTDEDKWDEIVDSSEDRAGIFDTLFTSPDYVEDTERSTVYSLAQLKETDL